MSSYPSISSQVDPFINIQDDPNYKPKLPDQEKIKNYKSIPVQQIQAHERDSMIPPPIILKPEFQRKELSMEDTSNFPATEMVPLPESIPYPEGRYRPPSLPVYAGYYPIHIYLYRGKVYDWCSCGHSWTNPWCNGQCKWILTRCRPIRFNVSESGYYKLCNCKMSANAPFCSGTHKLVYKWLLKSNKGFFHWSGYALFFLAYGYWGLIWYQ